MVGMRNRLVKLALTASFLVLLVQIVLMAPNLIRDGGGESPVVPAQVPAPAPPSGWTGAGGDIDKVIDGMHMIETQDGGKEWELWADKAVSFKSRDLLELKKVKAVFFAESGVTFTVKGEKGTVQAKSKDLHVEGDVVTRSSNGYVFRTPVMDYNSSTRVLTAPERVVMNGPKDDSGQALRLTGMQLVASLAASTMEVKRDVKAEKAFDRGRTAYIRSQRALFSAKDRTAKFDGDVILDLDATRITGPSAQFEYDATGENVRSVMFSGGARVSDADKWATAQKVKVDFASDRFVFRGSPRVVQDNDELRGEEIVFYDGGKRVQVKGARARVDERRMEKVN